MEIGRWWIAFIIVIILCLMGLVALCAWGWWHNYGKHQECKSEKDTQVAEAQATADTHKDAHSQCKAHLENAIDANKTMADANKQLSDNIDSLKSNMGSEPSTEMTDNSTEKNMSSETMPPNTKENFTNDRNPFYQDRLQGPPGDMQNRDITGITSQYKGYDERNREQNININNEDIAFSNDQLSKIPPRQPLGGSKNLGYDDLKTTSNKYPSDYMGTEIPGMPPGGEVGRKMSPDKDNGMDNGDVPMPSTMQPQLPSSDVVFPTRGAERIMGADTYVTKAPAWKMPSGTPGNTVEPIQREIRSGEVRDEMLYTNEASLKGDMTPTMRSSLLEKNGPTTPELAKRRSIDIYGKDYLWQPPVNIDAVQAYDYYGYHKIQMSQLARSQVPIQTMPVQKSAMDNKAFEPSAAPMTLN